MSFRDIIQDYISMADRQAQKLEGALNHLSPFFPLTQEKLDQLPEADAAFLDVLATRFGKLQDILGSKLFPLLLDYLGETDPSFRDKLNKLEKLGYLDSMEWWGELREIRNKLTHDYPDDSEIIALNLNTLYPKAKELLLFWHGFKVKLKQVGDA